MPQVKSEEVTLSKDLSLINVGTRVMALRSRGERQVAEIKNPGIPQDSQDRLWPAGLRLAAGRAAVAAAY